MSREYTITDGKLPSRVCPHCLGQVKKIVCYGQLSYECLSASCRVWGPWDEAIRTVPVK
jgi:hypothetical protein